MLGIGNNLIHAGALEEFSLDQISGLQMWLQNGEGLASGVAQWKDVSGQSRHAVQTTSGNQGPLEDGGIDFSTGDHYDYNTLTTSTFTVFVAMEPDSDGSMTFLSSTNAADFIRINQTAANEFRTKRAANSLDLIVSHSTDFSFEGNGGVEKFIVMFRQEGDNTVTIGVNLDFDNFALANSTGSDFNFEVLGSQGSGGSNGFDGTIYEVAIYNEVLNDSDATKVIENIASRTQITL
tara:strand:+ start:271 stop:978 length:708 start_codon:yes stop_codon:yes gene_type:complete